MTDLAEEKCSVLGRLRGTLSSTIFIFAPLSIFAEFIFGGNAFTVHALTSRTKVRSSTKHRAWTSRVHALCWLGSGG